jgi:hypothetical protein
MSLNINIATVRRPVKAITITGDTTAQQVSATPLWVQQVQVHGVRTVSSSAPVANTGDIYAGFTIGGSPAFTTTIPSGTSAIIEIGGGRLFDLSTLYVLCPTASDNAYITYAP